jgi:hypothetical protein
MPADRVLHPWRRYLRFSVRGLIVVVMVIGVGLGWIVRQAHVQRDAVAAIKLDGGEVLYDWEWSNGNYSPGGKPWAPGWFVDLLGVDYFGHVASVRLSPMATAPDAGIAHVRGLTRLEHLALIATSVSDDGLAHLKGLTRLSLLTLAGTSITDSGLTHLKGMASLDLLDLSDTRITDGGLGSLKMLTNLSTVYVNDTQVSDDGLVHLKALANLSELWLEGSRVSDLGLARLKGLTKLSRLYVQRTQVTDAGVNTLKWALPGLRVYR